VHTYIKKAVESSHESTFSLRRGFAKNKQLLKNNKFCGHILIFTSMDYVKNLHISSICVHFSDTLLIILFLPIKKYHIFCSYVKEWLCTLACGSIIEMDKTGEKFWIRAERIADLIAETAHPFTVKQRFVPLFANVFDQIEAVFRIDGPYGK